MTKRSPRPLQIVTLILLGVAALGCASQNMRRFRLAPKPAAAYSIQDGAVTIKTPEFRMMVFPLDDIARAAFIKSRVEGATDPFGSGPSGIPRYLSFRLFIENLGSAEPVSFQPQSIYLASASGDRMFPLDYPDAYTRLVGDVNHDPRMLEDLSKYLFDVGVSVPPGGKIDGLLVYPTTEHVANNLRMEFNFLQSGGSDSNNYDIYFVKEPAP
jgi:hypothetical protein